MLEMLTTEGVFCLNSFTLAISSADKSFESGSGACTPCLVPFVAVATQDCNNAVIAVCSLKMQLSTDSL